MHARYTRTHTHAQTSSLSHTLGLFLHPVNPSSYIIINDPDKVIVISLMTLYTQTQSDIHTHTDTLSHTSTVPLSLTQCGLKFYTIAVKVYLSCNQ